jgi:hypothetical protein
MEFDGNLATSQLGIPQISRLQLPFMYKNNITLVRYEVYALRDGSSYKKFREKIWRTHKNKYLYQGEFS